MPGNYHVLIVDDEKISRRILGKLFLNQGFEVGQAESGHECIEIAESAQPDLIFLDVIMPEMDGFETCRRLKQSPETEDIPVVFVSSLDDKDDILKSYQAGGADFIPKPIDAKITIAKANAILGTRELIRDKSNLLKMNNLILSKLDSLFNDVELDKKINISKNELIESSSNFSELLERLRENIEETVSTFNSVELNFQFTDRISQQMHELAKIASSIKRIMQNDESGTPFNQNIEQNSTSSVFADKVDQSEIDEILKALM